MYSINLVVRKTGIVEYTIYSDKGFVMHVLHHCMSAIEAMERAKAWGSSWNSVGIRMEDEKST